jgi:L-histidine N-alpha-methyltransferase
MTTHRATATWPVRAEPPQRKALRRADRFRVDVWRTTPYRLALTDDVRRGLLVPQKSLPPKYFYDDRGALLFDKICDLPEYYLTRTEQSLLERWGDEIVAIAQPSALLEFGSGASRKTRIILGALERAGGELVYMPMDVSQGMLHAAARALLRDYPTLRVHAIVGDYERDLDRLPRGHHRLVLFLGSTVGNFTPPATAGFLADLRRQLSTGEHFLLGVDLVKPIPILEAAYNDAAGVTAEFNRNVLRVINRELDATFEPAQFDHVAFFDAAQSHIEMHLRARATHTVTIQTLGVTVPFRSGETIHTEISRKFTRADVNALLSTAGFSLIRWYTPRNAYFALALARAT